MFIKFIAVLYMLFSKDNLFGGESIFIHSLKQILSVFNDNSSHSGNDNKECAELMFLILGEMPEQSMC